MSLKAIAKHNQMRSVRLYNLQFGRLSLVHEQRQRHGRRTTYNVLRIRAARSLRSRRIILIELSRALEAGLYLEFKDNKFGDVAQISRSRLS